MKGFIKQKLNEAFEAQDGLYYHGSPYSFDKFDTNRIGSGDGLNKFGHGLYFTNDINTALYYAKELSIGDLRDTGFNLYTVKISDIDSFHQWEEETPSFIAECVMRKLHKIGKSNDAEQIQQEFEEYGQYWELKNMYETLKYLLGGPKQTSEFLTLCGLGGVVSKSSMHNGDIYTVYDDSLIRIVNVEKIK